MLRFLFLSSAALFITCTNVFAQQPVLKAESYWIINTANNLVPKDSVTYSHQTGKNTTVIPKSYGYANNRGSYQYQYDTARSHRAVNNVLKPAWEIVQSFNTAGKFDTIWENQYTNITSSYALTNRYTYTYLPGGEIDSVLTENYGNTSMTWATSYSEKYTYNTNNEVFEINRTYWNATNAVWEPGVIDSFWYDNTGNIIRHRIRSWQKPGNYWNDTYTYIYEYDNTGKKIRDTTYANGVINNFHGYEYDANGNLVTDSSYSWIVNMSSWKLGGKTVYTYDANNNRTGHTNYSWNSNASVYVPAFRNTYTYNSHNQVTDVLVNEKWENGAWTINYASSYLHYYYGTTPVSIDHAAGMEDMVLYPSPAVTYTHLEMNFDKPTVFSVIIFDMQGRMVKQFTDKADRFYRKNITVQDMPPGQYVLQVKTNESTTAKNLTIIR